MEITNIQSATKNGGWPACLPRHRTRFRCPLILLLFEHPWDGGHAQVKARSRERLRHPLLPHARAQHCEPPHHVPDEIRKPVHRLWSLDQRRRALFIEPSHPPRNGLRLNQEPSRRQSARPAPCSSAELEDCQTFCRPVVWPSMRIQAGHASILDPDLLLKLGNLASGLIQLGPQPHTSAGAVSRPASAIDDGQSGKRDHVQDGGLHALGPGLGEQGSV